MLMEVYLVLAWATTRVRTNNVEDGGRTLKKKVGPGMELNAGVWLQHVAKFDRLWTCSVDTAF